MGVAPDFLISAASDGAQPMDGDALRRDLAAFARYESDRSTLRKHALEEIKRAFQAAREKIRAGLESGVSPGVAVARALSALQDTTVQVIYDLATRHFYPAPNPTTSERLAIVATGGYGRGMLAPSSDIDLLFIRPFKETAWDQSVIESVLHMLWDMGLKVGHATRSVPECLRLAKEDVTIRTSLLEARFLCGDRPLFDELWGKFWGEIATGSGQEFVAAKLAERDTRHARQGESRYLVEPNVKDGKGGLRDLQTLYWIGKYLYRVTDPSDLVAHGVFTKQEYKTFQKAEAWLWTVRCQLHYLAGRAEERLSFDVQPEIAKRLGYTDASMHRAVERFMRSYFLVAKDVGDLTRIFCAALEEQYRKDHPSVRRLIPGFLKLRSATDEFYVENGRLAARSGLFRENPVNLIRLFHVADSKGLDIHPATLRSVTRKLDLIGEDLRNDPAANRLFLEILCSRRNPETALRRMNEAGVMGRFMPEFGRVVALMQFNMYHHYTVDEHLLFTIGNLARMERGELRDELPLVSDLIKRVQSREVLYVAGLLHDMAKGLPGDHSEVGAAMAEAVCPRLGLSPAATATVSWLVRNHLVMSDAAQKRDVSDPRTVQNFVHAVQTPERLRLLLILTAADIRAVGPGVWNGWKAQLLRDLYYESETLMSGGDAQPTRSTRVEEAKSELAAKIGNFTAAERQHALSRHYDAYWLAFGADELAWHARLMRDADAKGDKLTVGATEDEASGITEIVIYTPDHPGLFSRLAGAISVSNGSIAGAKIFTTSDGYALDVFRVQDASGGPFGDGGRIDRLKQTIAKTLSGEIKPRELLAKRPQAKRAAAFQRGSRVQFDNDASIASTVIEVESTDRIGLLYDITRVLFEAGLSISSAVVVTYGELAVDVFYVRDGFGHKLANAARRADIEARLIKMLENETLMAV